MKDWLCRPAANAAAPASAMQANNVRQDGEADGDGDVDEDIDADENDIWTVLRVVPQEVFTFASARASNFRSASRYSPDRPAGARQAAVRVRRARGWFRAPDICRPRRQTESRWQTGRDPCRSNRGRAASPQSSPTARCRHGTCGNNPAAFSSMAPATDVRPRAAC